MTDTVRELASFESALTDIAHRLQVARHEDLREISVSEDNQQWNYEGRSWSWPAGEELTYFWDLSPGEAEILDTVGRDFGIDIIGIGTGRIVISLPSTNREEALVSKIARYGISGEMGAGKTQNLREQQIWRNVGQYPFLPIYNSDSEGDWIIMPKVDVVEKLNSTNPHTNFKEIVEKVQAALADYSDKVHPDELKPENIGFYKSKYWIIDYGRPTSSSNII
jgi:hypothetical protein